MGFHLCLLGRGDNIKELWKPIKNYEDLYEVSNKGNIKSIRRYIKSNHNNTRLQEEILRKLTLTNKGYLSVRLCKNSKYKTFLVHRLVAEAFIPNTYNYPEINHLDENKTNNNANNLEWCSHDYNIKYSTNPSKKLLRKRRKRQEYLEMQEEIKRLKEQRLLHRL